MYKILYQEKVTKHILPAIPPKNARQIVTAIHERLTADPVGLGKPLQYNMKGYWRLRIGNWRVIYRLDGENVIICDIVDRRDAYGD